MLLLLLAHFFLRLLSVSACLSAKRFFVRYVRESPSAVGTKPAAFSLKKLVIDAVQSMPTGTFDLIQSRGTA